VTPEIVNFGCRLNIHEAEAMRALVTGDTVVINSCAVTNEAVRQAKAAVRRARRDRPDAKIVVTGCAAQVEPDTFAAMPEVDLVLGNIEKLRAGSYAATGVRVADIMSVRETAGHLVSGFSGHARAFVEVQNGCDHRCTFCIIPFARGPARSVAAGAVIERVRALVAGGYHEVVLTGVDVTSWGHDLPGTPTFGSLVQRILTLVPELPRLRLSSLDPVEIDDALLEALGEARLMPHLHMSLQAGDDMILKRMKRRHLRADAIRMTERVRRVRGDVAFGADIIAGFPTEDEAAFANSLAILDDCDIVHPHIFPYSAKAGTPAARMPQVPLPVRKDRAARLRARAAERRGAWLTAQIGTTTEVLVERNGRRGHSPAFADVIVSGTPGSIVAARVTALDDGKLIAEAA
jgi:threonylcarbamoyladenosine tRNA methylthiotransferase MtaB